jgi:rhomboid family GlyGly-CTERM serine protease
MNSATAQRTWIERTSASIGGTLPAVVRLPIVTAAVAGLAIALCQSSALTDWLTFDRGAIAAGEVWRFFTGHLVHWNTDHLLWDVLMFAVLGAMVERRSRRALVGVLALSAAAISAAVWFGNPTMIQYRGLSGIDSALFTFVAAALVRDARRAGHSTALWATVAMTVGFVGKIGYEVATGQTLFVDSSSAGFIPLPIAHAIGGAAGIVVWLVATRETASKLPGCAPGIPTHD